MAASCPPVPEAGKVSTGAVVWKKYCKRAVTRRRIAENSGPRWLIIGRAISARTSAGTVVGPGIRRFWVGMGARGSTVGTGIALRSWMIIVYSLLNRLLKPIAC